MYTALHCTDEESLLQADQIAELLEIVNIRDTLREFDDDERRVGLTDTNHGTRSALLLTELGPYRLLGQSRKSVARLFQKWVASVVKEIRMQGKDDLECKLQDRDREAECLQLRMAKTEPRLQEHEVSESKLKIELQQFRAKTYEEVPKLDRIYLCREASQLHVDRHKLGKPWTPRRVRPRSTRPARRAPRCCTRSTPTTRS